MIAPGYFPWVSDWQGHEMYNNRYEPLMVNQLTTSLFAFSQSTKDTERIGFTLI